MHAWPGGHAESNPHAVPAGTLTLTHAFSTLPQWMPEQNVVVPGPMHWQVPAHGCPQPIEPAGAHVATVVDVVDVVLVVVVVASANGAQSSVDDFGAAVRVPN